MTGGNTSSEPMCEFWHGTRGKSDPGFHGTQDRDAEDQATHHRDRDYGAGPSAVDSEKGRSGTWRGLKQPRDARAWVGVGGDSSESP